MVQRIVRLEFDPAKVAEFKQLFADVRDKVRTFAGCRAMALYQDEESASVLYTVSDWDSADALEAYRHSELFASTWARMRVLFNGRPQAFTIKLLERVEA